MDQGKSISEMPEWINIDLLMNVLNRDENKGTKVNSWKIERASNPGTSFSSIVYRIILKLTREEKPESTSLIVKMEKTDHLISKEFAREVNIFNIAVPEMNKLLQEALSEKFHHFAPICYYAHVGLPGPIIILEDLKKESFRVAEFSDRLDLEHCLLVIKRLTQFHAASAVLFAKSPETLQHFKSSIYLDINLGSPRINFPLQFRKLAEAVGKLPEYRECFYGKLGEFADEVIDIFLDGVTPDENEFNILAHEDLWINNIMFQYEECKIEPVDVRIIDYQMCSWASPGIDIQRFLLSLGTDDVLEQYDDIVDEYYNVLRGTLASLGYLHLCPAREKLNVEVNRRAKFGILHGLNSRIDFIAGESVLTENSKHNIISFLNFIQKKNWI